MRVRVLLFALLTWPANVFAQGAVGSGPLTSTLAETEPVSGVLAWGPVKLAPGLQIRELGVDFNVFDERVNPKEDRVVAGTPDVSLFTRSRFAQVSAYGGAEMQYYLDYTSERSIQPQGRARLDLLVGRLRPFIGIGETRSRERANGEIDVRALHIVDERSGGISYEVSTHAIAFASAVVSKTDFRDARQANVSLDQTLSRTTTEYQAGLKTDITPLLSLQVRGSWSKEDFRRDPTRDGETRAGIAVLTFAPSAVVTGVVQFDYRDYSAADPLVKPYRGVTGQGFITYSFLELARVNLGYNRSLEFSFDPTEGYFIANMGNLAYTQRLFGKFDWQARGEVSLFNYGQRAGNPARRDQLTELGGSLGYNLRNRTRVALNYEYAERRSPAKIDRNYVRRRAYASWTFAF